MSADGPASPGSAPQGACVGSARRMRLSVLGDLPTLFPLSQNHAFQPALLTPGAGAVDDLSLLRVMGFGSTTALPRLDNPALKGAKWAELLNHCHSIGMQVLLGMAPSSQVPFADAKPFREWLFIHPKPDFEAFAQRLKAIADSDLPGWAGVNFDIEYIFGRVGDADLGHKRTRLADFYKTVAKVIAPKIVAVVAGAKISNDHVYHHLDSDGTEQVPAFQASDAALLHDWREITRDASGALVPNILMRAMAYDGEPLGGAPALLRWHDQTIHYATDAPPNGVGLPEAQYQLIIKIAKSGPKPNQPGMVTDSSGIQLRASLARTHRVGLALFPMVKQEDWGSIDARLNRKHGAPAAGTCSRQPSQLPIDDLAGSLAPV